MNTVWVYVLLKYSEKRPWSQPCNVRLASPNFDYVNELAFADEEFLEEDGYRFKRESTSSPDEVRRTWQKPDGDIAVVKIVRVDVMR